MLVLIPLLASSLTQPAFAEYKVVSVDRHEVYAGKLGREVTQKIVAEKDGSRFEITIKGHTSIKGSVRSYSTGDTIKQSWDLAVKEAR